MFKEGNSSNKQKIVDCFLCFFKHILFQNVSLFFLKVLFQNQQKDLVFL